jgi:hypothetical protein
MRPRHERDDTYDTRRLPQFHAVVTARLTPRGSRCPNGRRPKAVTNISDSGLAKRLVVRDAHDDLEPRADLRNFNAFEHFCWPIEPGCVTAQCSPHLGTTSDCRNELSTNNGSVGLAASRA